MRVCVAFIKCLLFLLWSALLVPIQWIWLFFANSNNAYVIPHLWQKGVCFIFGLSVNVHNKPHQCTSCLYVSNHISYLDIPVIGSTLKASFVAKEEVRSWPVFGFLSTLQQTAFIKRQRSATSQGADELRRFLEKGKSLILFPEGTTSNGTEVLPFKSSYFQIATTGSAQYIQPFTIKINRVDGTTPVTQADLDVYAWHGDMELSPHLWNFAKSKGAVIDLIFHDSVRITAEADRKILCKNSYDKVTSPY